MLLLRISNPSIMTFHGDRWPGEVGSGCAAKSPTSEATDTEGSATGHQTFRPLDCILILIVCGWEKTLMVFTFQYITYSMPYLIQRSVHGLSLDLLKRDCFRVRGHQDSDIIVVNTGHLFERP